jgi:hypothetical protein
VYFQKNVKLVDPEYTMTTDTLLYNLNTEIAKFLAPTVIKDNRARIRTRSGYYDLKNGKASFSNRPIIDDSTQTVIADSILYDKKLTYTDKIPDFDVLSDEPRDLCEAVVRELTAHKYTGVKYTKHKGIGEVISEHYDIRIGDEVIAFLYKPLACHSYNTIRIDNDSIRIATIDTMLSFYLAFIYANRIYYDINRILCMSQFLFDVQQHNRFKQTGLLKRFSINCYGNQPTLESMRFEKTEKYEELKNKRDTREYEEWFLRYIPYENAGKKKANKPAAASASGSKTRKRKQTKE